MTALKLLTVANFRYQLYYPVTPSLYESNVKKKVIKKRLNVVK